MTKKILVEVEVPDKVEVNRIVEELRRAGLRARVVPGAVEEAVEAIKRRWERLGRRARLGELENTSLEDEFNG